MTQINFRINEELDEFISLMSKIENKTKSTISKEIFLKGLNSVMLPYMAQLYKEGKISIKQISKITKIHPSEIISQVAKLIDDIDIDPELISYSEEVGKKLEPYLAEAKKRGITFKGTINIDNDSE
jgi:hypothetical protein